MAYIARPTSEHHTSLVPSDDVYPPHWSVSYNPTFFKGGYEGRVATRAITNLQDQRPELFFKNGGAPTQTKFESEWDSIESSPDKRRDVALNVVIQGSVARVFVSLDGHIALILQRNDLPERRGRVSIRQRT